MKKHKEKLDFSLCVRSGFLVIGENMYTIAVSLVIAQVNSTISAIMNVMQALLAMIMINTAGMEELGAALAIVECRFVGMSVILNTLSMFTSIPRRTCNIRTMKAVDISLVQEEM